MRTCKAIFLAFCFLFCSTTVRGDLLITGVFDGPLAAGRPKVIELFSRGVTDLSQYGVGSANNGGGSNGPELILFGLANHGDYIYVVDGASFFEPYFGFTPTLLFDDSAASINGNDAIELFFDSTRGFSGSETIVDTFGEPSYGGLPTWIYRDGWAYRLNGTRADGNSYNGANWYNPGPDVNDGKTTNTDPNQFPIGSYSISIPEMSSLALFGLCVAFGMSRFRRRRIS